jgi:hypothetical protein
MTANEIKQLRDLVLIFQVYCRMQYSREISKVTNQSMKDSISDERFESSEVCDRMLLVIEDCPGGNIL